MIGRLFEEEEGSFTIFMFRSDWEERLLGLIVKSRLSFLVRFSLKLERPVESVSLILGDVTALCGNFKDKQLANSG